MLREVSTREKGKQAAGIDVRRRQTDGVHGCDTKPRAKHQARAERGPRSCQILPRSACNVLLVGPWKHLTSFHAQHARQLAGQARPTVPYTVRSKAMHAQRNPLQASTTGEEDYRLATARAAAA